MREKSRARFIYFERWQHVVTEAMLCEDGRFEILKFAFDDDPETVWRAFADAHVYYAGSARDEVPPAYQVDAAFLARTPNLLCVAMYGAGYDTVDVAACTEAGVLLVNQAGGNREAVAEHALGLILAASQRIASADRAMRRDRGWSREIFIGEDIKAKTIGLVGLGYIGTRMAAICRDAFAMRVLACDPYLSAEQCARRGAEKRELNEMLAAADIVSVHCPRSAETEGMIGAAAFAAMRPGALFINTARGGIHDEAALLAALERGHLGGAGLDVWDREPPPLDHPLLARDDVIATPHIAGITQQSRREVAKLAAEQLIALLNGERPSRLINPDAWPRYAERAASVLGLAVGERAA